MKRKNKSEQVNMVLNVHRNHTILNKTLKQICNLL